MNSHTIKNSLRSTILLAAAFTSTAAFATPPSDAQRQARDLLTGTSSSVFAPVGYETSAAKSADAQAQARLLILGSQVDHLAVGMALNAGSPRIDVQTQARNILVGNVADAGSKGIKQARLNGARS